MRTSNGLIAFLVFFGGIWWTDGLDCYLCVSLTEIAVTVPGFQFLGDQIKSQLERSNNAACNERNGTHGIQTVTCPNMPNNTKADVYCTSADVRMCVHYVMASFGQKFDVTMSFRQRSRECSYAPKELSITEGCHDSKAHQAMAEKTIRSMSFAKQPEFSLAYTGQQCICDKANCNANLPPEEPGALPTCLSTGPWPTPTGGCNTNMAALYSVLACLLVFILFSLLTGISPHTQFD